MILVMSKNIYYKDENTVKFKYLLSLLLCSCFTLQLSYNGIYFSVRIQASSICQAEISYFNLVYLGEIKLCIVECGTHLNSYCSTREKKFSIYIFNLSSY